MRRFLFLLLACLSFPAMAWNAAGHRLIGLIAWQQLSPASQQEISGLLTGHPDYANWRDKANSDEPALIFAEAATWADVIRHDPRYFDADRETATAPLTGIPDNARHRNWHYADYDDQGKRRAGEIEVATRGLVATLRTTSNADERRWALVWLLHLVGDLHQPLHVGRHGDEGGNLFPVGVPGRRESIINLHRYWDDLPGPSGLRGARLERRAEELLVRQKAPRQATIGEWRRESHALLAQAYPDERDGLLPVVTEEFAERSRNIAEQRIVAAGFRLGRLLEQLLAAQVPRETGKTTR